MNLPIHEQALADWLAQVSNPSFTELRRGALDGYPVEGGYVHVVSLLVQQLDLQLTPAPGAFNMDYGVFHADYNAELRPHPRLYAFAVRDRLVAACDKLQATLAPGTALVVSPIQRITNKDGVERPFTGVVVEVSYPATPRVCVLFDAEQSAE